MRRHHNHVNIIPPVSTIPFQNGFNYINNHYASHIKTLCYNYSVNEDGLAYVIVEPTPGTVTATQKTIVIINSSDSNPVFSGVVNIASSGASWSRMQMPFAIEGFFGYVMPYSTTGTRASNRIAIFKFNQSTNQLDHIGSSTTWEQTLSLSNASLASGRLRSLSCFADRHYPLESNKRCFFQTSLRASSTLSQIHVWLDHSGGSSSYWSASVQYNAFANTYARNSVVLTANTLDPDGGIVHYGAISTGTTAVIASANLHVWRDSKINNSVVSPSGAAPTGNITGVELINPAYCDGASFPKANDFTTMSNYWSTRTIPYYTGSGATPIMFGLNTASGFRPFRIRKDIGGDNWQTITDLTELTTTASRSLQFQAYDHMNLDSTYFNTASYGEFCLPMVVSGTNYRWVITDTTSRQIVLA